MNYIINNNDNMIIYYHDKKNKLQNGGNREEEKEEEKEKEGENNKIYIASKKKMKNNKKNNKDNKNDNDMLERKKLLFPPIDKKKFDKLLIDADSLHYITYHKHADEISQLISDQLNKKGYDSKKLTIVDLTAGVGGNVLSFAKYFKNVVGIELIKERAEYCQNNVMLYNFNNVKVINGNSVEIIQTIKTPEKYDVFFIDPPWGGSSYKEHLKLTLFLGDMSIEKVSEIISKEVPNVLLVVLKLPLNYDIEYIEKKLSHIFKIEYYRFKKMLIVFLISSK